MLTKIVEGIYEPSFCLLICKSVVIKNHMKDWHREIYCLIYEIVMVFVVRAIFADVNLIQS